MRLVVAAVLVAAAVGCGESKCPAWTAASGPDVCMVPGGAGKRAPEQRDAGDFFVDSESAGRSAPAKMSDDDSGAVEAGKVAEAGRGGAGSSAADRGGQGGTDVAGASGAGQGGGGAGGMAGAAGVPGYTADAGVDAAPADFCGDGKVTDSELCDGNCPKESECKSGGCVVARWSGSAATCDAKCDVRTISEAKSGDGCCPMGDVARVDGDCPCGGDGDCAADQYCSGSTCHPAGCNTDEQCTNDRWCTSPGTCGLRRDGLCTRTRQCADGHTCKVDPVSGIGMCG